MKKILLLLFLCNFCFLTTFSQKINIDSIEKEKKIEIIRNNVQNFFTKENNKFLKTLKDFKEEYIIYFNPKYGDRGEFGSTIYDYDSTFNIIFPYLKPGCNENNTSVPKEIINYANFLLNKSNGYWCGSRFGFDNLKRGDDLGILFVFSPKNIPDSLSILPIEEFTTDNYEIFSPAKKRKIDLIFAQSRIIRMDEALDEKFIRVVLKY